MNDTRLKWLLLAPTFGLLAFMMVAPLGLIVSQSLERHVGLIPNGFEGVAAYLDLLSDPSWWLAVRNTLILMAATIPLEFFLGLGLALLLEMDFRFRQIAILMILVPLFAPAEAYTNVWKYFILDSNFGLIGYWTTLYSGGNVGWLTNYAFVSVFIIDLWKWTPFVMLILLAGLTNIPKEVHELASLDRLGAWQRLRHVTLPGIRPFILIALMFRILTSLKELEAPIEFTQSAGSPLATNVAVFVYNTLFDRGNLTLASAAAVVATLLTMAVTFTLVMLVLRNDRR